MASNYSVVIVTGSPNRPSRATALAELVEQHLCRESFEVETLHVHDLPAEALLHANFEDPQIRAATRCIERAHGVVIVSPVYKASYPGGCKAFIDLWPQYGLRHKVVLPLLVGGSLAHVLAIDYAVRPVLQSLDPKLIVNGLFVLDKTLEFTEAGPKLACEVASRLSEVTRVFVEGLRAHATPSHFDDGTSALALMS